MREPARRDRPARLRALVVVVAALSLFAQLSSFAHFVLVEHAVCPEHGEMIHAGEQGHHVAQTSTPERDEEQDRVRAAATTDASHEHDHCALLSDRRERLALRTQTSSLVPPPESELLSATWTRGSLHAHSVPILLLAPKNSPPA